MNIDIENKLKMLKSVQYTLSTNSDITSSFANEVGRYEDYLLKIRELSQKIINMGGMSSGDLEDNIKQASSKMAAALRAYASMTNITDLLTNEYIKTRRIDSSTGEELYNVSIKILEKTREYHGSLTLFGISENKVADFENMLYYFRKLNDKGDKVSPADVENVSEEALRFLEGIIDPLVEHEKSRFPKFYNEYKYARNILTHTEEQSQNLYFFA